MRYHQFSKNFATLTEHNIHLNIDYYYRTTCDKQFNDKSL